MSNFNQSKSFMDTSPISSVTALCFTVQLSVTAAVEIVGSVAGGCFRVLFVNDGPVVVPVGVPAELFDVATLFRLDLLVLIAADKLLKLEGFPRDCCTGE